MTIVSRMARVSTFAMLFGASVLVGCANHSGAALHTGELRTEYRENPLGLGMPQPRLSWKLSQSKANARNINQSAYRIIAASSKKLLTEDSADLWNTGKVDSDETIQIPYAGRLLQPGQECWWRVCVWDNEGKQSAWSEPARFSAGIKPETWQAKWIGYDAPAPEAYSRENSPTANVEGMTWYWSTGGPAGEGKPEGDSYFRKVIDCPEGIPLKNEMLVASVDDSLTIYVNGKLAGNAANHTHVSIVDLSDHFKWGKNVIAIKATNGKGPAGIVGRIEIKPEARDVQLVPIDESWKCSTTEAADWTKENFDDSGWSKPVAIAKVGDAPWGTPGQKTKIELPPPPYLRKEFKTEGGIKRATLYATALGVFEFSLNGQRVSNAELAPGWTDYNDRVYYQTYDVTSQVKRGKNALGAILGDGWYAGYYSYQGKRSLYGTDPRLFAQLVVEYDNGTSETIGTDETWKAAYGPLLAADLLAGCEYDARLEIPGWDTVGYDDAKWQPAVVASEAPKIKIEAQVNTPLTKHETIDSQKITETKPGVYTFDLGQNMVGWTRLKLSGKAGTTITIRQTEMLNADGSLYTTALRGARATDAYTFKGDGVETFEPKFTFHGFRYVEITGLDKKPNLDAVTGIVVHSNMERTGEFSCSNADVNQLFHNIIWGQKGNYFDVPFDCPQRDERLGWTGDAQFFIRTGAYNFNVAPFFTKWVTDLDEDSQYPDGSYADVAPDVLTGHGNTAWGDAGIVCPYTIYRVYGDKQIIRDHFKSMQKYLDYLHTNSKDFVRGQGAYGDWLNQGGGAKPEVVGTAYFAYVSRLMSEMARAINRTAEADKYADWATKATEAFRKNFLKPDGSIQESSQTGFALAFTMGLIPDNMKAKAAQQFVSEIEKKNWHLATGFIGTPRLLPALEAAGQSDVAYRLLLTDTFPSWLYQVKLGATTMWERWDGWSPEKGFQDPGMNSFNHYAFGSVGQFMYGNICGIETDTPGFKTITIKPVVSSEFEHAEATYESIRGTIRSGWKKTSEDGISLDVTIPPNTTATIYVPATDPQVVSESGKPWPEQPGIRFIERLDGYAVYKVASGSYHFASKI